VTVLMLDPTLSLKLTKLCVSNLTHKLPMASDILRITNFPKEGMLTHDLYDIF